MLSPLRRVEGARLVVAKLAWSIENMLNRVIEGSIEVSEPVLKVIADVITLFPELATEYASSNNVSVMMLISWLRLPRFSTQ